jgi:Rho GDP-dissociation inhibitor
MLGSYGPSSEPCVKDFDPEESPSGLLARSGTCGVRSRVIDDDGEVYAGLCFSPSPSSFSIF